MLRGGGASCFLRPLPAAAAILAGCISSVVSAQDFSLTLIEPPPAVTEIYAGPSVFSWPQYPGSQHRNDDVLPMVEAFGHKGWFLSSLAGAGWNFSPDSHWQYGLRLTPVGPRLARETPLPAAVTDIGWRIERGAFLNYCPHDWLTLMSDFRQGSGRRDQGTLADIGAMAGLPLRARVTLAFSGSATWGNAAYTQSYFGVDAGATATPYSARAGLVNTNADIMLLVDISKRWSLTLDGGRITYHDAAARSPLVTATSGYTWFAGAEYQF